MQWPSRRPQVLQNSFAPSDGHQTLSLTHQFHRAGLSALGVEGQTLQSFAGCGVPKKADNFGWMFRNQFFAKWQKLRVLIIDEISMVQVRPPLHSVFLRAHCNCIRWQWRT